MNSSLNTAPDPSMILFIMDSSNETCKVLLTEKIEVFFASACPGNKITVEILQTTLSVKHMAIEIANKKPAVIFYFELRGSMPNLYDKKLSDEIGRDFVPRSYSIRPKGAIKTSPHILTSRSLTKVLKKESPKFINRLITAA
jgi:glutaredoxin-related protein